MLTKREQKLCLLLLPQNRKASELEGVFYNEQALYRSARRMRDFGLLNYKDGMFSITFKGLILAHIIDDYNKIEEAKRKEVLICPRTKR